MLQSGQYWCLSKLSVDVIGGHVYSRVINYAARRYGGTNNLVSAAWVLLIQGIYNCTLNYEHHCRAIPVVRPRLGHKIEVGLIALLQ